MPNKCREVDTMNIAEKISRLRRQRGWSQEELAERMNVSRQAVSKWESTQSSPDLEKLVQLSELFGVTTDELLKDDAPLPETLPAAQEDCLHRVTMSEAEDFLAAKEKTSWRIALGAFLCIVSPVTLIVLAAQSELSSTLAENTAAGIGMVVLFVLVAAAAMLFISSGAVTEPFAEIKKGAFSLEPAAVASVRRRQSDYRPVYMRNNMAGTLFCMLSVIPLFLGIALNPSDATAVYMTAALLAMAGVGVVFFIRTGVVWAGFQTLLQEGEYDPKVKQSPLNVVGPVYWLAATAIYLAWSFATDSWSSTWIVWPVAGVLYAAVCVVCRAITGRSAKR